MFRVSPLSSRNQLGQLLVSKGLVGSAVEIGTHRGEYARILLDNWPGQLFCVDPWSIPPGYEVQARKLISGLDGEIDRERDYLTARRMLRRHKRRVMFLRCLSEEAVSSFKDHSLDFVYIDGNHEPPYPDQDLSMWWPKVTPGGVIAGHDFVCPGKEEPNWGDYIAPALIAFFPIKGLSINLIVEENGLPWSYYVEKPL